jgi:CRP/FNR family cyclic AMP-dependent transcriptional regulator
MSNEISGINDVPLFKLLTPFEIQSAVEVMKEKKLRRGENVFVENQDGDTMYIISSGTVKITKMCHGKELEVVTLYAGDFFGEIALFERVPRTGTAKVIEDVMLIAIARDDFAGLISRSPYVGIKILYRIIQDMAKRLQRMNVQNESMFI